MANWSGTYTITSGTTGTLTSATATTATNAVANWPTGAQGLTNFSIRLLTGPGSPATVTITGNTSTQVTVASWPNGTPNNTTTYEIVALLKDQDHIIAATTFGSTTIVEVADNATVLVDGAYIITLTNACTVRFNKTPSTIATFCANNRTVQGKAGFWSYITITGAISVTPSMSYIRIQDAGYPLVLVPSTVVGNASTISNLWGESLGTASGYMTGAASPAGGMTLSNYYIRSGKSLFNFSTTSSANSQTFANCWVDKTTSVTTTFTFAPGGSTLQWFRDSVIKQIGTSDINTNSGVEFRISNCYLECISGSPAFGAASATDAGTHAFFNNISRGSQTIYGANVIGTGTMVILNNDIAATSNFNATPGINILNAATYASATSNYDYIAGNNSASFENVDTTTSTSSTASPQQYLNLTSARTNPRTTPNFPFTIDNVVVGTPTGNSCTITFDCANGAVAGQGSTVNADSASGQPILNVASSTPFRAGMVVEVGYGTARQEILTVASTGAGTITFTTNLAFTHTAVQTDTVLPQLRQSGLGFIQYGTSSGVYTSSTAIPDVADWGLFWTQIQTSYNGQPYSFKKTGLSATITGLSASTTYYAKAYAYNPFGELISASSEVSFTTTTSTFYTDPGVNNVLLGVTYQFNSATPNRTGNVTLPSTSVVKIGTTFGPNLSLTGTYTGSDRWTDPGAANVLSGVTYLANAVTQTGTLLSTDPGANNVLAGTNYYINSVLKTGTFTTPTAAQIAAAVWDEVLASHTSTGSAGLLVQQTNNTTMFFNTLTLAKQNTGRF